jgi:flagellin
MNEIGNMVVRLRELSVQSASDTIGPKERSYLNNEYQALKEEVDRIANSTDFNGTQLLDGTGGTLDFQINTGGDNILGVDRISFDAFRSDVNIDKLGIQDLSVVDKAGAQFSLSAIDKALDTVSGIRGDLGAIQNRLASTINNLGISVENLSSANSRIKDVDIAEESAELTRNNILMQAGTSVLQQSNSIPKMALGLLQQN